MKNFYGEIEKIIIMSGTYQVHYVCGTIRQYETSKPFIDDFIRNHVAKMYGWLKIYK